jgi:DnaD/phage-associated family protein
MKIELKYTGSIINLPSKVASVAPSASRSDLLVIVSIFEYMEYFSKFDACISQMASNLHITESEIKTSLAFWHEAGVLNIDGIEELNTSLSTGSATEAPTYTGAQISSFVEKNKKMEELFYECQNVLGKTFNKHDHDSVVQLKHTYRFSNAYILLLLAHCVEVQKTSWQYIRKLAAELYDQGVHSYKSLEEHFASRKNKRTVEYKIRKLFGIGNAEFTKTQREIFGKWIDEKVSFDLISKAYEITVDKTGKISLKYMAKIIENWFANGLKTIKQVEESEAEYKKNSVSTVKSSFDADDFFAAALKRSYAEMEDE